MYTEQDVIAFAKWWYGIEADDDFKGRLNVPIEQCFEWWSKNVRAAGQRAQPAQATNSAGWDLDNISDRAIAEKVPRGRIACPHCGAVVAGRLSPTCPICDKLYFAKEKAT